MPTRRILAAVAGMVVDLACNRPGLSPVSLWPRRFVEIRRRSPGAAGRGAASGDVSPLGAVAGDGEQPRRSVLARRRNSRAWSSAATEAARREPLRHELEAQLGRPLQCRRCHRLAGRLAATVWPSGRSRHPPGRCWGYRARGAWGCSHRRHNDDPDLVPPKGAPRATLASAATAVVTSIEAAC